jgi:glycosyltransferase involved in cell wall biosynthesis
MQNPQTFLPISAIILTFNEEENLPRCLASLVGWIHEIYIVDSGSTDRTVDIAHQYDVSVHHHPFETHARQWKWGLTQLPLQNDWVLGLDADQAVTPELQEELTSLFHLKSAYLETVDGIYMKRRQIFRGKWIRHGAYYPKFLLKLFRKSRVELDDMDLMDHHFYITGPTLKLNYDIIEDNSKEQDLTFWLNKHARYARLHAEEELRRVQDLSSWAIQPSFFGSPDQRVIWLKQVWYRLPLFVRPLIYFLYRYFIRLGFLDGKQGFIFHFLQGFWYRLLVDIHLDELLQTKANSAAVNQQESN